MPLLSGILAIAATGVAGAIAAAEDHPDTSEWWLKPGAWVDQRDLARLQPKPIATSPEATHDA